MSISKFSNRMALNVGAENGLNVALSGMAVGAGFGLIGGAISDQDTLLSGALKGGMIGLPLGAGVKYVGSKYSKGFIDAHGTEAAKAARTQKNSSYGWNTDYFSKGSFSNKESFMDRFG